VLAARAEGQTMHRPSSAGASAEATPNVIAPGAISGLENAPDPVGPDAGAAGPMDSQFHSDSQPSDHP
jgi:hypothetical protein